MECVLLKYYYVYVRKDIMKVFVSIAILDLIKCKSINLKWLNLKYIYFTVIFCHTNIIFIFCDTIFLLKTVLNFISKSMLIFKCNVDVQSNIRIL